MAQPGARRRVKGEGSVFEQRPGLWRGVLELGMVNGKRVRKTYLGKTRKEVAPDPLQQSAGAPQQRDPPAHQRRRYLPNRDTVVRLVGAVLTEQTMSGRRSAAT